MRVLVISNLYPPNVIGGYERLCFDVTARLADRGHNVTVLTSEFGGNAADYPGQTIHRTLRLLVGGGIYSAFPGSDEERKVVNGGNIDVLRETLLAARPDVVFAWNLFFLDRSFVSALGEGSTPVVTMLTDNWLINMERPDFLAAFMHEQIFGKPPVPPQPPAASGPARGTRWWRRALGKRSASRAAVPQPAASSAPAASIRFPISAVFGSNFVRDMYAASGIAFQDHQVVHNGVTQAARAVQDYRDRSRLVTPGELRLLFAGRLVDLKGAHTAVEALALLDTSQLGARQVRLTIVGDTLDASYLLRLQQTIARSGRATQIEMQEPVPEAELFDLFQSHDIYLFPSLYEPFSLTLIHALACGIPTIASRAGGNVEIVCDRRSGLLFDAGDPASLARAVTTLARDADLRRRIAEAGRGVAGAFTFDAMVSKMESFLRERIAA